MLSMDKTNTNWKVYENLKSHYTEKTLSVWHENQCLEIRKKFKGYMEVVQ